MVNYFAVITLLVIIGTHFGESAVTHEKRHDDSLNNWKDRLSQVLDTESQELKILHNLIEQGENEESHSTPKIITSSLIGETTDKKSSATTDSVNSIEHLREEGIISKLEENSKRMDSMVTFLSDLKNVLSIAISSQDKQMRFETEVVELREEIGFLRKELQHLKNEQTLLAMNKDQHSMQNKITNDEAQIQWLKDSTIELRGQLNDLTKICNATALLNIQQTLDQQSNRQNMDLLVIQKQIQGIQLQQLKQEEQLEETNGNIGDLRSWQTTMGQKFIDGQLNSAGDDEVANLVDAEEHFLTEALKDTANFPQKHGRHSKKLKARLREISKTTKLLAKDHYHMTMRLDHLEKSQKIAQGMVNNGNLQQVGQFPSEIENRLIAVEEIMTHYTLSLQNVGDKVNVVNELQESTTQMFSALEDLETRYDEKFTEMHTNLVKMESSVSGIVNSNEDLKEAHSYQVSIIQNVKKELMQTKDHLQKNHFRLASLQTQLLAWSSQKCSLEDSESIQNIRISSLESTLQFLQSIKNNKHEGKL